MYFEALLFGVTLAIAIGPIALLIVNASINRGIAAGMACGAGAASADFTFALAGFGASTALLALLHAQRAHIAVLAALALCALGVWIVFSSWRQRSAGQPSGKSPGFAGTYLLTLANPLTILLFAAWIGSHERRASLLETAGLACAVFIGSLSIQLALALGGGMLRPLFARPGALRVANLASGLGLAAFGIVQLLRTGHAG